MELIRVVQWRRLPMGCISLSMALVDTFDLDLIFAEHRSGGNADRP